MSGSRRLSYLMRCPQLSGLGLFFHRGPLATTAQGPAAWASPCSEPVSCAGGPPGARSAHVGLLSRRPQVHSGCVGGSAVSLVWMDPGGRPLGLCFSETSFPLMNLGIILSWGRGAGGKTSTGCLSSSSQPTCQTEETLPETLVFMYPLRASSSPNFSVATHCSSLTKKSPGGTVPHTTHRACTQ